MAKIQEPDNSVLNRLYTADLNKSAAKKDEAGQTETAFKDHEHFLDTLESVLSSDSKESWDPNDPILD